MNRKSSTRKKRTNMKINQKSLTRSKWTQRLPAENKQIRKLNHRLRRKKRTSVKINHEWTRKESARRNGLYVGHQEYSKTVPSAFQARPESVWEERHVDVVSKNEQLYAKITFMNTNMLMHVRTAAYRNNILVHVIRATYRNMLMHVRRAT